MISIPVQVDKAMEILEQYGFEVYAVGGCVRDMLMGKMPYDWDLCTSAEPIDIKTIFDSMSYRTIDTGIKHGTVTVIIDKMNIEITTYRLDNGSADHRHPDEVVFTKSLEEDLQRRDFTINSLAYNPRIGLIDMHNGIDDIRSKVVRAIGEPNKRFDEDALRIMRGVRFATTLGFRIDTATSKSILGNVYLLEYISKERISAELTKILLSSNAGLIAKDYLVILRMILPNTKNIGQSAQSELANSLNGSHRSLSVALAVLWYYLRPSDDFVKELRYSNEISLEVDKLRFYVTTPLKPSAFEIKRILNSIGVESFYNLLTLKSILCEHSVGYVSENPVKLSQVIANVKEIVKTGECYSLGTLQINGDDLVELGYEGRAIGDTLELILQMVWSDNSINRRDKLMSIAGQLKSKK